LFELISAAEFAFVQVAILSDSRVPGKTWLVCYRETVEAWSAEKFVEC